jgi:hypothetical protein
METLTGPPPGAIDAGTVPDTVCVDVVAAVALACTVSGPVPVGT